MFPRATSTLKLSKPNPYEYVLALLAGHIKGIKTSSLSIDKLFKIMYNYTILFST
ncbi:hypothetical protein SBF1_4670002 [Candidatus Desulfosporosinus infrequens]|uniref:Uncharacterized protein n=1 Tax=Candidatus Desulfosporosinus infrequens TaxID=2043169 RepID=A0A2U3LDP9_9FIRM|nr:hypothetical protein SBF1_4670002 [Candidatus Desulfosporosinus infrequens]